MSKLHAGNMQNEILYEEHEGTLNSKKATLSPLSIHQNASLVSGYTYYGFTPPGTSPDVGLFRLLREELNTGNVLFGGGTSEFIHTWSSASLASISYS